MRSRLLQLSLFLCCLSLATSAFAQQTGPGVLPGTRPAGAGGAVSGPILFPDGTLTAPSIAFAGEPGLGFRRRTNFVLTQVGNGGNQWEYDSANTLFKLRAVALFGWTSAQSEEALDTTFARAAARVVALGPTTGVRLDWSSDGVLALKNFAGTGGAAFIGNGNSSLTIGQAGGNNVDAVYLGTSAAGVVFGNASRIRSGSGTPEGAVTAAVGSIWLRTDGGAGTSIYVKESGAGNTGWVAK